MFFNVHKPRKIKHVEDKHTAPPPEEAYMHLTDDLNFRLKTSLYCLRVCKSCPSPWESVKSACGSTFVSMWTVQIVGTLTAHGPRKQNCYIIISGIIFSRFPIIHLLFIIFIKHIWCLVPWLQSVLYSVLLSFQILRQYRHWNLHPSSRTWHGGKSYRNMVFFIIVLCLIYVLCILMQLCFIYRETCKVLQRIYCTYAKLTRIYPAVCVTCNRCKPSSVNHSNWRLFGSEAFLIR